ncbi:MAG: hypothetical protein PUH03_02675 [bacterium]|nr:hypothetical protein [bacterium]MDY2830505.1 hypothetical protein [Alphaproteobacteria bacterium]
MKFSKKTGCLLIVLGVLTTQPKTVCAQISIDIPKGVQKVIDGVKEQFIVFQDAIKGISESQFATMVGNGIDAAKKGIAFSKNLYKDVQQFKKDVENSKALEAAKLSKQIAEETKRLKEIQEEKKQKQADAKADAETQKTVLEGKIEAAQNNFKNTTMADTRSGTEGEANGENGAPDLKTQAEQEIEALQSEIKTVEENLTKEMINIEKEYDTSLYEQGKKIVELSAKLKNMMNGGKDNKDEKAKDPEEAIKEVMADLSFKKGDIISVGDKIEKEKKRNSKIMSAITATTSTAADRIAKTNEEKEENENTASVSGTLNGKSEGAHISVTSTISQAEALYTYLILELQSLQEETNRIISIREFDYEVPDEEPKGIDVCDYKRKKK